MSAIKIQDRKLRIIEQLIIMNGDEVFQQIEELINKSLKRPLLSRFSVSQLMIRAEQSNLDIAEGKLFSQDEVEEQAKSW
jgi:hypothetical protein